MPFATWNLRDRSHLTPPVVGKWYETEGRAFRIVGDWRWILAFSTEPEAEKDWITALVEFADGSRGEVEIDWRTVRVRPWWWRRFVRWVGAKILGAKVAGYLKNVP